MNIMIQEKTEMSGTKYFTLSTDKKEAFIAFTESDNCVNVLCKNAMHKAWRGTGRFFWGGWEEALAAYKSADMKAMIETARELSA